MAFNAERPPADNYHDFNDKDDDNSIDEEQQWKARRAGEQFAATFNQLQKDLLDYHDFNGDNIGDGKAPEKKTC